ncbi:hypothetical protein F8388_008796 [Cannabis sativa]|uniref:Rhamnogalacturonan endolyase n=1 Tax=Cannabis sativa TaxID=3483 RepID=A0A7J6DU10_CANSA|nr:hypothetical protein F8388_008796 [Cannabis sativa]
MEIQNWSKRISVILGSSLCVIFLLWMLLCSSSTTSSQTNTIRPIRKVLESSIRGRELLSSSSAPRIIHTTQRHKKVIVLDNGLVQISFSNPGGDVIGIKYNNMNNLLEPHNKYSNRGYWDIEWGEGTTSGKANNYDKIEGTHFEIIEADENHIEISFVKKWNDSSRIFPVNMDKRFIMLRNYSGFYTYGILEHPKEAPATQISVVRAAFKLQRKKFNYMAISDDRQRTMPSASDRTKGKRLAYAEAVVLTRPSNPDLKGEILGSNPSVGFWVITPSHEFLTAGPMKQELTSHVGPTSLSVFLSCHYVGKDLMVKLEKGETWKKDYPLSDQRGSVIGQLFVKDRYLNKNNIHAKFAYVGLAAPGNAGSWQWENKGYQFWSQADEKGNFIIKNVRPGNYNLYAWVPGVIGDYVYNKTITIQPGSKINLNNLLYQPPRNGPTLWEIGIPDRTASEFYVPHPLSNVTNRLFIDKESHRFRQYGLWDRYTDLYPEKDLEYTVGVNDYRKDWFFAHVNRKLENGTYRQTTWQVKFNLENVVQSKSYTLQLALASASASDLQVRMNERNTYSPIFSTHLLGRDNSIARHGIHGTYWMFSINISGYWLRQGQNILYLTSSRALGPFGGVLYDYLRFEAPSQT